MTPEQAKKLREPFRPEQIGKIPKGGIEVDYVGHAATTDRLLQVDPDWTWEPMTVDPDTGAPLISNGGMWIRLTVCGVTRPGFGDGKNPKEIIGDAIRNAAMRFGVALDLWAKEDLSGGATAEVPAVRMITDKQSRLMMKLFRESGFIEREHRLAFSSATIERRVASSKDLTEDEASRIIHALEHPPEPDDADLPPF